MPTPKKVLPTPLQNFSVDITLNKSIIGSMTVRAKDKEHAKEKVFVQLDFKVNKGY